MNLRQIELLRAVMRCETTVRAAQELGLSQPAVSNGIRHLEAQLGFSLFERVNNRLFPTAEARALYRESETLAQMHSALEATVQDLQENRAGRVRVLATPPLGYSVIPRAISRFLTKRPKVRIFFDIRRFEHVLESVDGGLADLGFVLGLDEAADVAAETVFSGDMVCVMPPGHALAERSVVTPADLRRAKFVALERDSRMGSLVRRAVEGAGEPYRFAVEVRYCHAACVLVQSGVGVAVVDPLTPRQWDPGQLVIRPFVPACPVSASVVQSRKRILSPVAAAFLREARAIAAEMAGQR